MVPQTIAAAATIATTTLARKSCKSSASTHYHHHHNRRRQMSFLKIPLVVLVFVFLLSTTTTTTRFVSSVEIKSKSSSSTYLLDKDTRDDCLKYVDDCSQITTNSNDSVNDQTFYLSCPITCSNHLHFMGGIGETTKDPDTYYYNQQLNIVVRDGSSNSVTTKSIQPIEDLVDGYVTIFAMLPMTESSSSSKSNSGMVQYYYELLYHVGTIHKYSLQIFLQPIDFSTTEGKNMTKTNDPESVVSNYITEHPHSRSNVLRLKLVTKETIPKVIDEYVLSTKPLAAGGKRPEDEELVYEPRMISKDRVTLYIVSADGKYVEQLISPTFQNFEERLLIYISQLQYGEL